MIWSVVIFVPFQRKMEHEGSDSPQLFVYVDEAGFNLGESQEESEEHHWLHSYSGCTRPTWTKHYHVCCHHHEWCHCLHTLDWTRQQ